MAQQVKRRRERRYPRRYSVALEDQHGAELEALADDQGIAVGVLIRNAFRRGWPAERSAQARLAEEHVTEASDG